jgi:hypothetical protein
MSPDTLGSLPAQWFDLVVSPSLDALLQLCPLDERDSPLFLNLSLSRTKVVRGLGFCNRCSCTSREGLKLDVLDYIESTYSWQAHPEYIYVKCVPISPHSHSTWATVMCHTSAVLNFIEQLKILRRMLKYSRQTNPNSTQLWCKSNSRHLLLNLVNAGNLLKELPMNALHAVMISVARCHGILTS